MTTIIIAEKPDAAERLALALADGKPKKKASNSGVSYYEFERNGKKHIVVAAVGHLFNLKQTGSKGWTYPVFDVSWEPSFKIRKQSAFSEKYFKTLEEFQGSGSDFIVACDYDNEGCIPSFEKLIIKEDGISKIVDAGEYIELKFQNKLAQKWKDFEYIDVADEDILVPAFSENSPDVAFVKVKKFTRRHGDKSVLKIKTEHGRSIHVSKNHPCFILSNSGLTVKRAEDVQIGDYLPIAKSLPFHETKITQIDMIEQLKDVKEVYVYGSNQVIGLMPAQMAKKLGVSRKLCLNWKFWDRIPLWAYHKLEPEHANRENLKIGFSKAKRKIPAVIELDRDFGRLIGYYLAEGCIDTSGFIGFYFGPTEDSFVNDVSKLFKKVFYAENVKYRKRAVTGAFGDSITPEIGTKSRAIAYLFSKILKLGKCSGDKNIPSFILSTPIEFISGLIDGYLAGDGSAFKDKNGRLVVSAGSKSRSMIEGLHMLLLKLGINSSIIYDKNRDIWFFVLGSFHEIKKIRTHNILQVFKKSGLKIEFEKENNYINRDPLMLLPNFILNGCSVNTFTEHNMNYSERTSQQSLLSVTPFISRLLAGNLHFFKVKKIEKISYEGPFYDLETATSSFMHGNGVITHNSVIGYNVLKYIFKKDDAKRMKFSTLTKQDLVKAYEEASPKLDFPQIEAGIARHTLDFFYGINTSRALTLAIKKAAKRFAVLSAGRVQGPVLCLLAEKESEIQKFIPKPYWQLELKLDLKGQEIIAQHEDEKLWNEADAKKIFSSCKSKTAQVEDVEKKNYRQSPPVPFNITSLQTEAYRFFGFSPQQTLSIAQELYTKAYISYPRTSSEKLPPQIGYREILEALAKSGKYEKICKQLLELPELKPNEGKRIDPAHESIHPTVEPPKKILAAMQQKVYDLVCKRFFAVFGKEALREAMKISILLDGNRFVFTGRRTLEKGWMDLYGQYAKFDEIILPELKKGDSLDMKKLDMLSKQTAPPPRFSQASIIKEMEKRELGTRATRAAILQTLYDRKYIQDKSLKVTNLGMKVAGTLKKYVPDLVDEKLTRKFDNELEKIMQEKVKKEKVLNQAKKSLIQICAEFREKEDKIGKDLAEAVMKTQDDLTILGKCVKCGEGDLKVMFSPFSKKHFVGCTSYSKCAVCGFTKKACKCKCPICGGEKGKCACDWKQKIWTPKCQNGFPLPGMATIQKTDKICELCKTPIITVIRKGRRPFKMCIDPLCKSKESWGKPKDGKNVKMKKSKAKQKTAKKIVKD